MESLNLNTLASSLPTAQQNAEKEILNDFKAAALSITTLYRSSRKNSKRAYNAGYAAACQDLLNFIQQGVSASDIGQAPSGVVEGGGMTIGRVMDWTEARVDAIKAREEEEDEDEEREKDKERAGGSRPSAGSTAAVVPVVSKSEGQRSAPLASTQPHNRRKGSGSSLPTPNSPVSHSSAQLPSEPSSPSPPPPPVLSRTGGRPTKVRPTPTKEPFHPAMQQSTHILPSTFLSDPFQSSTSSVPFPETPIVIGAGAKRRHAVMMMLDSNSPAISIGGQSSNTSSPGGVGHNTAGAYPGSTGSNTSKRRTRSSRNLTQLQPHNPNIVTPEDMDVEEDGRERKRVARR